MQSRKKIVVPGGLLLQYKMPDDGFLYETLLQKEEVVLQAKFIC